MPTTAIPDVEIFGGLLVRYMVLMYKLDGTNVFCSKGVEVET